MKIYELGHVVLYVSSLAKSASFYKDILGFHEIHRDLHTALYSGGRTHHELLLIEVGGNARSLETVSHPTAGLYHIGLKVGDSKEMLREVYQELTAKGVRVIGATDHHVTNSLYILDPDNNEIELYVDVDDSWKTDPKLILQPAKRLTL
jgi:catechol-2,3-dioxygenase